MKKVYAIAIVSALVLALSVSCSKKEEKTDNTEPAEQGLPQDPKLYWADWRSSSSVVSSASSSWINDNAYYALYGDGKGKACISTSTTAEISSAARGVESNRIGVKGMNEGDCIDFTLPSQTLAKGSTVDFMINLMASGNGVPKYWIFEYEKDGEWVAWNADLRAEEDPELAYSFYIKYFSAYQYTTFTARFPIERDIEGEDVRMRIRAVGKINGAGGTLTADPSSWVCFLNFSWIGARITACQGIPVKDTRSILVLGNSFTHYYSTNFQLLEIARSQGHALDMVSHIKGGQSFGQHLSLERTTDAINNGPFDYALLQDQSVQHSIYYFDPSANAAVMTNTKSLIGKIKAVSPSAQVIIENTWAYMYSNNYNGYGSYKLFDKALEGGALLVTSECGTWMSPIRLAFEKARSMGISGLYHSDDKHPGLSGTYLKACVDYLLIYGEKFDSNVPNGYLSAVVASQLRAIAEEVVLDNMEKWRNPDASGVVPGEGLGDVDPDEIVQGENGIKTAEQLISFAKLANAGGDISSYCNSKGEVVLLADIDLPVMNWTPIGSVTGTSYSAVPSPTTSFKGVFDGQGHSIKGLAIHVQNNTISCMGFFGATSGATIRNVVFEDVKMDFTSTGISSGNIAIGTVAGYASDTVIEDVEVHASFTGKATSTTNRNVSIGGIAGIVTASSALSSSVSRCVFNGSITNDIGITYSNSHSAAVSGIVGGIPNTSACKTVLIKDCVNKATIDVKCHRAAGIIGNTFHVHVEGCVNEGDISCSQSESANSGSVAGTRMGGIMAYCTSTTTNDYYLKDCTNKGTVRTTSDDSACGGVAGLIRTFTLTSCSNSGNVYAPTGGRGLMVGRNTSADVASTFTDCAFCGKIGNADGSDEVTATADNYLLLGVTFASGVTCPTWNSDNVKFLSL